MNAKSPFQIWWKDICAHWRVYVAGLVAMLLTNSTEVLAPKTLQWIIDALFALQTPGASLDALYRAVFIFFSVAGVGVVGRVFWRMTLARMTHVASNQIKRGIWDSIRSSSLDSLGRFTLGDLMNRSIGDVNSARWIYGFTMVLTCDVIFFSILGSISMMMIDPFISSLCLATFILIPPIAMRVARREFQAHEAAQGELTVLSENVSQAVRGIRSQRAGHALTGWIQALNESAGRYAKLRLRSQNISINSFPLFSLPTIISYGILLAFGPSLVRSGEITIGAFAAMASYVFLLQGPLGEIGDLVAEWQRGFASLKRISEIQNLDPHIDKTKSHGVEDRCVLEISDLKVSRSGRDLFSHVSLQLYEGQWLGIKGAVGCGKSTLLQVVCGVAPFEEGRVSLRNSPRLGATKNIAYAPEKPFVFSGTVRRNLSLNTRYSDAQLWDVLRLVDMEDCIKNITAQLDGFVGEGGVTLSGGQRQRLALARVLLRVNGLLVLDDPLSAVDVQTETKIISSLKNRFSDCSVIWASNRISTLECCDRVLHLTPAGLCEDQHDIGDISVMFQPHHSELVCPSQ
jgi:ATP-binding cassette subfamily B multidrug efflux pump